MTTAAQRVFADAKRKRLKNTATITKTLETNKKKKNNTEQKQKQQLEVLELKKLAIAERTGFQCSIFIEEDPTFTVLKCVCAVQQKKG